MALVPADEMKKAKLIKLISEKLNRLEENCRKKNIPSFDEIYENAKQKVKEQEEIIITPQTSVRGVKIVAMNDNRQGRTM